MVEALYGCQFADCAVDVSYPAHMLKMLNGAPVCEDCVDDMGKVDWLDLEKFVPPEQAKIADLQAKLNKAVESLKIERENTIKECASTAIKLGQCGNVRGYADCCERTAEDIEQSILALITAKPERDE